MLEREGYQAPRRPLGAGLGGGMVADLGSAALSPSTLGGDCANGGRRPTKKCDSATLWLSACERSVVAADSRDVGALAAGGSGDQPQCGVGRVVQLHLGEPRSRDLF
eukprot:4638455-Prymnesium_polylepis.2